MILFQDEQVFIQINSQVESFLYSQGFSKVTLQPEFPAPDSPGMEECHLKCVTEECLPLTCCTSDITSPSRSNSHEAEETEDGVIYLSEISEPGQKERLRRKQSD